VWLKLAADHHNGRHAFSEADLRYLIAEVQTGSNYPYLQGIVVVHRSRCVSLRSIESSIVITIPSHLTSRTMQTSRINMSKTVQIFSYLFQNSSDPNVLPYVTVLLVFMHRVSQSSSYSHLNINSLGKLLAPLMKMQAAAASDLKINHRRVLSLPCTVMTPLRGMTPQIISPQQSFALQHLTIWMHQKYYVSTAQPC
jgi:hypothetical protein